PKPIQKAVPPKTAPATSPATPPATPSATPPATDTKGSNSPKTTAVVPASNAGLPTTPGLGSVEDYVSEIAPSGIVGRPIKFSKDGEFVLRDTEETVSEETDFIAIVPQTVAGYMNFNVDEGEPPVRVMGLIYEGFIVPPADKLPDRDESQWPTGLSGMP